MIEKKTMGYADFGYPQFEAKAVTVIADGKTGKVVCYQSDDEWCAPNEKEHFFDTVAEAADALDNHKRDLLARMSEVRDYVLTMNHWKEGDNEVNFKATDYLPYVNALNNNDIRHYRERFDKKEKENDYLIGIIRSGFINICGESFRKEDVVHIQWGKEIAELHLTDSRKVKTCNEIEFNIISDLFGGNSSKNTFTRLNT